MRIRLSDHLSIHGQPLPSFPRTKRGRFDTVFQTEKTRRIENTFGWTEYGNIHEVVEAKAFPERIYTRL